MTNQVDKDSIYKEVKYILDNYDGKLAFHLFYKQVDDIFKKYHLQDKAYYPPQDKEYIIIPQFNGIGDAILNSGFLRELRKNKPNAHITILCAKNSYDIYKHCPYVDNIICVKFRSYVVLDFITDMLEMCHQELWDHYIDLALIPQSGENNVVNLAFSWILGANAIVGYGENNWVHIYTEEEQSRMTEELQDLVYDICILGDNKIISPPEMLHDVPRRFFLLECLGMKVEDRSLEIWLDEKDLEKMKQLIEPLEGKKIAIGLGGYFPAKHYSPIKYVQALKRIYEYEEIKPHFLLIGGDLDVCDRDLLIEELPEGSCVDLVNKYTIGEAMAAVSLCDLYIGNDTGTAHMASVFKVPIIELMSDSKAHDTDAPLRYSEFRRFRPWTDNAVILRPMKQMTLCQQFRVHGGCCYGSPDWQMSTNEKHTDGFKNTARINGHCINTITAKNVFEVYKAIVENGMNANINTNKQLAYLRDSVFKKVTIN